MKPRPTSYLVLTLDEVVLFLLTILSVMTPKVVVDVILVDLVTYLKVITIKLSVVSVCPMRLLRVSNFLELLPTVTDPLVVITTLQIFEEDVTDFPTVNVDPVTTDLTYQPGRKLMTQPPLHDQHPFNNPLTM